MLAQQLQHVAVTAEDAHGGALFHRLARDRADQIVGFMTRQHQDGDVERGDHVLDADNLRFEFVGHFFARALVRRVEQIASGQPVVKGDRQIVRLFAGQQVDQRCLLYTSPSPRD